jgi:hypothetical protein
MRWFIRLGLERLLVVVLSHLFLRLPSGCNSDRQNRLPRLTSSRLPNREPVIRLRCTDARNAIPGSDETIFHCPRRQAETNVGY